MQSAGRQRRTVGKEALLGATQLQHIDHGVADFVVAAIETATARGHGIDAGDGFADQGVETLFLNFVGPVEPMLLAHAGRTQRTGAMTGDTVLPIQLRPATRLRIIRSGRGAIVGTGCQPQGR